MSNLRLNRLNWQTRQHASGSDLLHDASKVLGDKRACAESVVAWKLLGIFQPDCVRCFNVSITSACKASDVPMNVPQATAAIVVPGRTLLCISNRSKDARRG